MRSIERHGREGSWFVWYRAVGADVAGVAVVSTVRAVGTRVMEGLVALL